MEKLTLDDWRNIAVIISVIVTPLVVIIGWYRQSKFQRNIDEENKKRIIELDIRDKNIKRLETQISDFYAPIYALRVQCETAHYEYRSRMPKVPRNKHVIDEKNWTQKDHIIHDYITDEFLIPYNNQIADIIKNKSHLIIEKDFPQSLIDFIKHTKKLEIVHNLITKHKVDVSMEQDTFPKHFTKEIKEKLDDLRNEYFKLLDESKLSKD